MVANELMRVIILVISNALTKRPCSIVGEEETVLRHGSWHRSPGEEGGGGMECARVEVAWFARFGKIAMCLLGLIVLSLGSRNRIRNI
jgi:hypothetical protein